jgi:hypothetical protein
MPVSAQMGGKEFDEAAGELVKRYLEVGKETFRFDAFGGEDCWGTGPDGWKRPAAMSVDWNSAAWRARDLLVVRRFLGSDV